MIHSYAGTRPRIDPSAFVEASAQVIGINATVRDGVVIEEKCRSYLELEDEYLKAAR